MVVVVVVVVVVVIVTSARSGGCKPRVYPSGLDAFSALNCIISD